MFLAEIWDRLRFWREADRIGPDIPLTHWRLHFKSTMGDLCRAKFLSFGVDSEFRAGAYAICCSNISVGDRVVIRPGCMLFADQSNGGSITIEDDVMLGAGVHVYVNNHKFDDPSRAIIDQGYYPSEPVLFGRGSWIGAGAIILPGVRIGRNAVVGAGSIVTKDVPAFTIVVGNPAQVLRRIGEISYDHD